MKIRITVSRGRFGFRRIVASYVYNGQVRKYVEVLFDSSESLANALQRVEQRIREDYEIFTFEPPQFAAVERGC